MLNVNEIRNLEDMWKRYKRKKYTKIFFYIFLLLIVATIPLLFYFGLFDKILSGTLNFKQAEIKKVLKKEYQNKIISVNKKELKKITPKSYKSKQNDINQSEKKSKNVTNYDINHTKNIVKNNIVKPIAANVVAQKSKNSTKEENITANLNNNDILQLNTKFLNHIYTKEIDKNISKNILAQSTKKQKKQSVKNNNTFKSNSLNIKKERPKIIISSKKIDKLKYLKERYNESGRALYAILLSKEYYRKKMYKKSLIWATTANNIDSSNEDSWIMFAKCKVKLGKKNDAINALRAYLKVNSSKKIRILLANIINGVFR